MYERSKGFYVNFYPRSPGGERRQRVTKKDCHALQKVAMLNKSYR